MLEQKNVKNVFNLSLMLSKKCVQREWLYARTLD